MLHQNVIFIVGAGAVGRALAVFLKLNGKEVIILRGSIDDSSTHYERIEVQVNETKKFEEEIEVSSFSRYKILNGIVVLTNKSYGNEKLAHTLKAKIGNSPVVIMQNGLDIEKPFIDKNFPQIYRCVLFTSSQLINSNTVKFRSISNSPIGEILGDRKSLELIVYQLNNDYLPFRVEENIQPVIWTKAIVNSVFNSICPLLEVDNGIFIRNEKAFSIAMGIINECVVIAKDNGVLIHANEVADKLLMIAKTSDGQLISTYQDILSKRKTEIDTMNFALVNRAKDHGEYHRPLMTQVVGELVKIKAQINDVSAN